MTELKNALLLLLKNDVISETHFISDRENVNTIEDIADELVKEYYTLKILQHEKLEQK